MKEIKEIIRAYSTLAQQGKRCALATLVHVDGSSYRRPGARMLISEDGKLTGAISGGCLEGDALRKALNVINTQFPTLVTYDTSDEDDATIGVQLGCNGIIQVLIEPIKTEDPYNAIHLLKVAIERRKNGVLITTFCLTDKKYANAGTLLYMNDKEEWFGRKENEEVRTVHYSRACEVLENKISHWQNYSKEDKDINVFYEYICPPIHLVVAGAGNDVIPLTAMAEILGWEIQVIDGRPAYAKQERFHPSCQVLLSKPEQVLDQVSIDDQTVFALMTHNYNFDKTLLNLLCKTKVSYIAMLGPKKKLERMLGEFEEEGCALSSEEICKIFSPAGMDIGANTSEEIALSILAEIQAMMSGKLKYSLREKHEGIHM